MKLLTKKKTFTHVLSPRVLTVAGALVSPTIMMTSVAAEEATNEESTGWIDVYVDHRNLDDAVSNAESAGVDVIHEDSQVLTGDADATEKNSETAKQYYADKAKEITKVTDDYKAALVNYEAEQATNNLNAQKANAVMDGLRSNLSAADRTVVVETKTYSAASLAQDMVAVEEEIANGKRYQDVRTAVTNANSLVGTLVNFETQANQGNIKLSKEVVTVASQAEIDAKMAEMQSEYRRLEEYVAGLVNQNGSIPDDQKPSFKTYSFVVNQQMVVAGTKPVTVYNYTPVQAERPTTPVVSYHYFDVRSKPKTDRHAENADGEEIVEATKESNNGAKVVQALVNQVVGVETDNQPLPSDRFDKMHHLEINTYLPAGVEWDKAKSNIDGRNWRVSYDETNRIVRMEATSTYLVEVNKNQNLNNAGSVGGTVNGQWQYDAPAVYFKLLNDDATYQVHSETIVNDEYLVVGKPITIQTSSANPEKHNYNSKFVNIDGKAVLPGSVNNYRIRWDFDQYKGVNLDREMQAKGTHLVDDYPEEAVELTGPITIEDEDGKVVFTADIPEGATSGNFNVNGLSWSIIEGKAGQEDTDNAEKSDKEESSDEKLLKQINGKAIKISLMGFDNEIYKEYVEQGRSLYVRLPMTTKKIDNTPNEQGGTYNGNKYSNVAYQSDFGNNYKSNEVINIAPLIDPRKDAVASFARLESLDLKANPLAEIEKGTKFYYRLKGSEFPSNLSEEGFYYAFTDEMDVKADEYTGEYIVESNNEIHFKAGSQLYKRYASTNGVMPANTDITKHTSQTIARNVSSTLNTKTQVVDNADSQVTRITVALDADFMEQIDWSKTSLNVEAFLKTERIADVDGVVNVFNEKINAIDFGSNEVTTNSRESLADELRKKIDELKSRADADDKDDEAFQAETRNALSVVIKSLESTKENLEAADKALDTKVEEVKETVKENTAAIEKNATVIRLNTDSITAIRQLVAELSQGFADLSNKTKEAISTVTIYDSFVTSDAEALLWVADRGVSPQSIKSINLNEKGQFVVSYNSAEGSLTGSKQATPGAVNKEAMAKSRAKVELYAAKTEADAYKDLASMGYRREAVLELKNTGSRFEAVVDVALNARPTVDVKEPEVKEDVKVDVKEEAKPEVKEEVIADKQVVTDKAFVADNFLGHQIEFAGVTYNLVKTVVSGDKDVAYQVEAIKDGKGTGVFFTMSFPQSVVTSKAAKKA